MYQPIGIMQPGPLDTVDWDAIPVNWFAKGWCGHNDPASLEPFRAEVERQLNMAVGSMSLIGIKPGGHIHPHEDGLTSGWTRRHLVLRSNEWCWSYHDGDWQQLTQGGLYMMDANKIHASINLGETMRWHLIADSKQ